MPKPPGFFEIVFSKFRKKPRRQTGSTTSFKDGVNEEHFSFEGADSWIYEDRKDNVKNPLISLVAEDPHFILRDGDGVPRFILRYDRVKDFVQISSIQRERTQYVESGEEWEWSSDLENKKSKEFQAQLGMHPSEFLLSEFLHRYSPRILNGLPVTLFIEERVLKNYRGLIDRFFERKPVEERRVPSTEKVVKGVLMKTEAYHYYLFRLNLRRERVRQILGMA